MVDLKDIEFYKNQDNNWKEENVQGRIEFIPKDWFMVNILEVFNLSRGASPRPIENFFSTNDNDINWIKIGDTNKNNKYIFSTKQKVSKRIESKLRLIKPDDFLLSNSMSFGKPYISKIYGAIHDGWLLLENKNKNIFSNNFYFYQIDSNFTFKQFLLDAIGSTVDNLSKDKVAKTKTLVYSIEEQEKIATILETQEELLNKLNKLNKINKKNIIYVNKINNKYEYLLENLLNGTIRVK